VSIEVAGGGRHSRTGAKRKLILNKTIEIFYTAIDKVNCTDETSPKYENKSTHLT
jgi:hypothetical protein